MEEQEHAEEQHAEEEEHAHPRYILIWVILLVLTLAELGYAFLDLPKVVLAVGLILMAVWKAVMVGMYYMHLRYEPARLWILAISPLPLAFILVMAVITEF